MKKRVKIVFAFTLLAISLCLTNNTYSRYIADSNGDVDIEFAKWQLLVNTVDVTSSSTSNISTELNNHLYFELIIDGKCVNPENYYEKLILFQKNQ